MPGTGDGAAVRRGTHWAELMGVLASSSSREESRRSTLSMFLRCACSSSPQPSSGRGLRPPPDDSLPSLDTSPPPPGSWPPSDSDSFDGGDLRLADMSLEHTDTEWLYLAARPPISRDGSRWVSALRRGGTAQEDAART